MVKTTFLVFNFIRCISSKENINNSILRARLKNIPDLKMMNVTDLKMRGTKK